MIRILIVAGLAGIVAGCGSSGTLYRGAPPDGMTDAEYRCKLTGQGCQQAARRLTGMQDNSDGGGGL